MTHTHTPRHTVWWKCYLSISQLNVLISLVAHGCLGKQQSQLQKAESIHLRGCQSSRQRAEVSVLPEPHGCIILFSTTDSESMPLHTFSLLVYSSNFFYFSSIQIFVVALIGDVGERLAGIGHGCVVDVVLMGIRWIPGMVWVLEYLLWMSAITFLLSQEHSLWLVDILNQGIIGLLMDG